MEIKKEWLEGKKFKDAVRKEVVKDGQKIFQYVPRERDLKPGDVLSITDKGDGMVNIVTTDGQKYNVKK